MKLIKKFAVIALFFAAFFGVAQDAHAIFILTASPRRGGQGIRFEAGKPGTVLRNEEVTLSVTTDRVTQYRIYQTVYQPLSNQFGNTIPQGALIAFSPSNPLGTLRTQLETPVTMGQVPIYTSNSAGDSDNFVLVFNVKIPDSQPGGVYHTTLTFTVEPVNAASGVSPSVVNMDVSVDIQPDFRITIQNVKSGKDLNFGKITNGRPNATEAIAIHVESNIGSPYKITQQMADAISASDGAALEDGSIAFAITGGSNGTAKMTGSPSRISEASVLLYLSNDKGAGDDLQVQYSLSPSLKQKAGNYAGNISFKIESNSTFFSNQVFNIPVYVEIEPVFYLDVEADQGSGLHFGTYRTGEEKQDSRVVLTVHSNLGEPYQVTQIVSRKLTNQEGAFIPKEHFTFFGSEAQTGLLTVMSSKEISEGESVVFTSNKTGSPEKFILNYTLTVPKEAKSGSYSSDIKYSITTL